MRDDAAFSRIPHSAIRPCPTMPPACLRWISRPLMFAAPDAGKSQPASAPVIVWPSSCSLLCLGASVGRSRVGLTLGPRPPCLDSLPEHAEVNPFSDHLSVRLQCQARAVPGRPGPAPHLPARWRHRHSRLLPVALAHLQPQPYHQAAVRCSFPDCA